MTEIDKYCAVLVGFDAERIELSEDLWRYDSPRAGGGYTIASATIDLVADLTDQQRSRLTTWLVDQRRSGNGVPNISEDIVAFSSAKRGLSPAERAERLLSLVAQLTLAVGEWVQMPAQYRMRYQGLDSLGVSVEEGPLIVYAWSESTHWNEVRYCLEYLCDNGWLRSRRSVNHGGFDYLVTVDGYARLHDAVTNIATKAFVAMWFHESTEGAYYEGIAPAIQEAGYNPLRIDQKPDVVKIDDEIIAEIRTSRFLVADFTQHEREARGGVYFEAGFAMGLETPVIFTCRKDVVDANNLHFDTRQYAHIVWENPEQLRVDLLNRIRARIGQGPIVG